MTIGCQVLYLPSGTLPYLQICSGVAGKVFTPPVRCAFDIPCGKSLPSIGIDAPEAQLYTPEMHMGVKACLLQPSRLHYVHCAVVLHSVDDRIASVHMQVFIRQMYCVPINHITCGCRE